MTENNRTRLLSAEEADLRQAAALLKAGELVNHVAKQVGGKGGGRPDMAQAGGTDPSGLDGALNSVGGWVQERLG